eukprot:UN29418
MKAVKCIKNVDGPQDVIKRKRFSKPKKVRNALELHSLEGYKKSDELIYCGGHIPNIINRLLEDEKDPTLYSKQNYFSKQVYLKPQFRNILLEWILRVHQKSKSEPNTLNITINIIDRYLTKVKNIRKTGLQLIGGCALWIASKYNDVHCIPSKEIAAYSHDAFGVSEMRVCEADILSALDFDITVPISLMFLERYLLIIREHPEYEIIRKTAIFLEELFLMDVSYLCILPSVRASVTFYNAILINLGTKACDEYRDFLTVKPCFPGYNEYQTQQFIEKSFQKIKKTNNALYRKHSRFINLDQLIIVPAQAV